MIPQAGQGGRNATGRMGAVMMQQEGWASRNVAGEVDRPNSAKDPKGMESLSFSLVHRDALPH